MPEFKSEKNIADPSLIYEKVISYDFKIDHLVYNLGTQQ